MRVNVTVSLKAGVLDPQGQAIENALGSLGFKGVSHVTQSKLISFDLDSTDADAARTQVTDMCEKLLANTVIERYDIALEQD